MPIVDRFNGIKVHIYNGEHRPPHIHAVYNEYEVLIDIEKGVMPLDTESQQLLLKELIDKVSSKHLLV